VSAHTIQVWVETESDESIVHQIIHDTNPFKSQDLNIIIRQHGGETKKYLEFLQSNITTQTLGILALVGGEHVNVLNIVLSALEIPIWFPNYKPINADYPATSWFFGTDYSTLKDTVINKVFAQYNWKHTVVIRDPNSKYTPFHKNNTAIDFQELMLTNVWDTDMALIELIYSSGYTIISLFVSEVNVGYAQQLLNNSSYGTHNTGQFVIIVANEKQCLQNPFFCVYFEWTELIASINNSPVLENIAMGNGTLGVYDITQGYDCIQLLFSIVSNIISDDNLSIRSARQFLHPSRVSNIATPLPNSFTGQEICMHNQELCPHQLQARYHNRLVDQTDTFAPNITVLGVYYKYSSPENVSLCWLRLDPYHGRMCAVDIEIVSTGIHKQSICENQCVTVDPPNTRDNWDYKFSVSTHAGNASKTFSTVPSVEQSSLYILMIQHIVVVGSIMIVVVLAVCNVIWRKKKIFKVNSPYINLIMLTGFLFSNFYILTIHATFSHKCIVQFFCLVLSFSIVFTSILAKTYRIGKICAPRKMKVVVIKDSFLIKYIAGWCFLDVILFLFWALGDPSVHMDSMVFYKYNTMDQNNVVFRLYCVRSRMWNLLIWGKQLILLAMGVKEIKRKRIVQIKAVNDVVNTTYCIYLTIMVVVAMTLFDVNGPFSNNMEILVRTLLVAATSWVLQWVLMGNKIMATLTGKENEWLKITPQDPVLYTHPIKDIAKRMKRRLSLPLPSRNLSMSSSTKNSVVNNSGRDSIELFEF
jgi:hypothetical protein